MNSGQTSHSCRSNPTRWRQWAAKIGALAITAASLAVGTQVVAPPTADAAIVSCTQPSPGFNNCQRFTFSGGNQTFVVPKGVSQSQINARMWGGAGGSIHLQTTGYSGGAGGFSSGTVNVTAGASLSVTVGGGGAPNAQGSNITYGGGSGVQPGDSQFGSSAGGGLSGLWAGAPFNVGTALLIAGGGGGGTSISGTGGTPGQPGGGGGANGGGFPPAAGGGGTPLAGGLAGSGGGGCPIPASAGSPFLGGMGAASGRDPGTGAAHEAGGGGGGGWRGGGGGRCRVGTGDPVQGGGGGGSGRAVATATVLSPTTTPGGNGVLGGTALPPNFGDSQYVTGVGRSVYNSAGGAGLVVIQFTVPAPVIEGPPAGSTVVDDTPVITGTGTPGTVITLTTNGTPVTCAEAPVTVDADGNWTCTPSSPLPEGPNSLVADASDPVAPLADYPLSLNPPASLVP